MERQQLQQFLDLAKICKATYAGPIRHTKHGYDSLRFEGQKIVHGSNGKGYCRIFWNDEVVVIAFRGTRDESDWIITNLRIYPVQLKDCGDSLKGIKIHTGFQSALNFIDKSTNIRSLDAIDKHLRELNLLNGRKIVITGHSLGGALAILYAAKLNYLHPQYSMENLQQVVTFGSPAVGLKKFKSFYSTLNDKTFRIINKGDGVPFTPPFYYFHVGEEIWLNNDSIIKKSGWRLRLVYALKTYLSNLNKDHDIKEYILNLQQKITNN